MTNRSLASRLFLSAAAWSVVALLVAGYILVKLYEQSVVRNFDQRLDVYLKLLVASLVEDFDESRDLQNPRNLGEPRFEIPLSGWYWSVGPGGSSNIDISSKSLFGESLRVPLERTAVTTDGIWRGSIAGPAGHALRVVDREIAFSETKNLRVLIAGNADEVDDDVQGFGTRVAATLAIFGLGLVLTTLLQVRFGLRPLDRLRKALFAIRSGKTANLEGQYPAEIAPLVSEMNALIGANREIVERSRTHVGNLAHALKTPLSVIGNEARSSDGSLAEKVAEQTQIMDDQISHHLERARAAASRRVIGAVTDVTPVADRLMRAMRRIHEDRQLNITFDSQPDLQFLGEQHDLEEMLGNLVDNACKWASSHVAVTLRSDPPTGPGARPTMAVEVEDDGPGLTQHEIKLALQRGRRLDESVPGSGLGLSIVNDLAVLYGGSITLQRAATGGLKAQLRLPVL